MRAGRPVIQLRLCWGKRHCHPVLSFLCQSTAELAHLRGSGRWCGGCRHSVPPPDPLGATRELGEECPSALLVTVLLERLCCNGLTTLCCAHGWCPNTLHVLSAVRPWPCSGGRSARLCCSPTGSSCCTGALQSRACGLALQPCYYFLHCCHWTFTPFPAPSIATPLLDCTAQPCPACHRLLVIPYQGKTWVPPDGLFYAATVLAGFTGAAEMWRAGT